MKEIMEGLYVAGRRFAGGLQTTTSPRADELSPSLHGRRENGERGADDEFFEPESTTRRRRTRGSSGWGGQGALGRERVDDYSEEDEEDEDDEDLGGELEEYDDDEDEEGQDVRDDDDMSDEFVKEPLVNFLKQSTHHETLQKMEHKREQYNVS